MQASATFSERNCSSFTPAPPPVRDRDKRRCGVSVEYHICHDAAAPLAPLGIAQRLSSPARTLQRPSAQADSVRARPVRSQRTRGNSGGGNVSRRTRPLYAIASSLMNPRTPLAAEPCPLVSGHFRPFATSRYAVRIATPGETNTKRRRNPAEAPNRALERIAAAPSMSSARSVPMAITSHTSSPEKPQRSMPQHHRTDSAMPTGIHPA